MPNGFDIEGGKDAAVRIERARLGGEQGLTRGELEKNADKLARLLHSILPGDAAFVLVLVPRDSEEFGVTASTYEEPRRVEKVLQKALKRVRKHIGGA